MAEGYAPKILVCSDCEEEFVVTAEAQAYLATRGFTKDPRRCKSCFNAAKRRERQHTHGTRLHASRTEHHAELPVTH